MLLRLAWRNIWRHPRRTALTAAAGVFAVVLTLFTMSLSYGSHERWIDQVVRLYPGHIEVSRQGYRENRTLDYGMELPRAALAHFDHMAGLDGWAPRLESWALAMPDSEGSTGRAAWLVGVSAEREQGVSRLGGSVRVGRFVDDSGALEVVLGVTLAENLNLAVGDRVILIASDYYGSQSADRFQIVGLLDVGDSRFDGYAALVGLETLQQFLVFPGGISHVAFFATESEFTDELLLHVEERFSALEHEILTWPDLVPDIVQFVILDDIGGYLSLAILIVVVAFGLLNTILMSVFERVREFGVMRAMGVRPRTVFGLVLIESAMISLVGIAIGLAIGIPMVLWFGENPLPMPGGEEGRQAMELFNIEPVLVFRLTKLQITSITAILLGVSFVAALPPALRASRGRPVDALRET
jgi:ABC-type lipoprotein release transport system permease subunit